LFCIIIKNPRKLRGFFINFCHIQYYFLGLNAFTSAGVIAEALFPKLLRI
jgi:hypothetical protein